MIPNLDINNLIWMYRNYEARANECWDVYKTIEQASFMWEYYMSMVDLYRLAIISHI